MGSTSDVGDGNVVVVQIFNDCVKLSVGSGNGVAGWHTCAIPSGYGGEDPKVSLNVGRNTGRLRSLALVAVAWCLVCGAWNRDVDVNGRWRGGAIDPSLDRRTSFGRGKGVADGLESPASVEELLDAENGVVVVEGIKESGL